MNKMFASFIDRNMEVYVDDMLIKSKKASHHVDDLAKAFGVLLRHQMKLNPKKCAFGVASGKFLGSWSIKGESKQIQTRYELSWRWSL